MKLQKHERNLNTENTEKILTTEDTEITKIGRR